MKLRRSSHSLEDHDEQIQLALGDFDYEDGFPEQDSRGLKAYNPALLNNQACQDLEVVDACAGTSVGRKYLGNFAPYDGECAGNFYGDLPIYYNKKDKLYLYAIEIYPEDWSLTALRGLVRWRIASFETFEDRTTCRYEEANIYQVDFAADGQPYNYHPTLFCFDENGSEFSGFKASTLIIICNDIVITPGAGGGIDEPSNSANTGLIVGIVAIILLTILGAYCWEKRQNNRGEPLLPCLKVNEKTKQKREASKEQKKKEQQEFDKERYEEEQRKELAKREAVSVEEAERKKREAELLNPKPAPTPTKESVHSSTTAAEETSDEEPGTASTKYAPRRNFFKPAQPTPKEEAYNAPSDESNKNGESNDSPPAHVPVSTAPAAVLRATSQRNLDPPARIGAQEDAAVPRDIKSMVAKMDKQFDSNFDKNQTPTPKKKIMPPPARSSRDRSKSREPPKIVPRSRSRSRVNSDDRRPTSNRSRSRSINHSDREPPKSSRGRSRSINRSAKAPAHPMSRSRSRSIKRPEDDDYDRRPPSQSRSSRHMNDDYDQKPRSRSRSIRRSEDDDHEQRPRSRSRSVNKRATDDDYESLSRSRHDSDYDRPPSRSIEPSRSKAIGDDDGFNMAVPSDTIGSSKAGKDPLDASKANRSITKQDDGSVLVIQKRTREDGAIATTKTKYANVALAKKHGVDID